MKFKYRLIIGFIGCLLLFVFGITRMLNDSLSNGSLIFALISVIGSPIAAIAIAINYKRISN
jgi:hypothetical protein